MPRPIAPARSVLALVACAVAAACGYDAPNPVDAAAPAYHSDLRACNDAVPAAVNERNAKTGLAWMASPIRRWSQIGDGVSACMADKGWGRIRACTPDERRQGGSPPNRIVTAAGIQCVDPGARAPSARLGAITPQAAPAPPPSSAPTPS